MRQQDLFTDVYPDAPGYRNTDTSKAAAEAIKPIMSKLQRICLELIINEGGLTPDECAGLMHRSILTIRPRFSELAKRRLIFDSGEQRFNTSSKRAIVWKATVRGRSAQTI